MRNRPKRRKRVKRAPRVRPEKRSVVIPEPLWEWLGTYATEQGYVSRSDALRALIRWRQRAVARDA